MLLIIFQWVMYSAALYLIGKGVLIWLDNKREDDRNV